MNKKLFCFWTTLHLIAFFLLIMPDVVLSEKAVIKKGDYFPELLFDTPADPTQRAYLGIAGGRSFRLHDIRADIILVEIMNINCSSCQKQAPVNNKLFSLMESTAETKGRIKMLAIAVGCQDVYIQEFVSHFNTPYPVIQDPKFVAYDAIGRSSIPLAVLIKREADTDKRVVVWIHSGYDSDYEKMFNDIESVMDADPDVIKDAGKAVESRVVTVKPVLSDGELKEEIEKAFAREGDLISHIRKINLRNGQRVYTSQLRKDKKDIFAVMVDKPNPCDVCHDVHFIYVFDATGKILQLIPLELTKYGNEPWDAADIEKIRQRIVGRYIQSSFDFDPEIDAVSSATITSSIIFRSLEEEQITLKELKEKGFLQTSTESSNLRDSMR